MANPFVFEGEARRVGQTADVAVWTDSISLTVEMPEKGDIFPAGVPAFRLQPGKRYRVTVESLD